MKAMILERPHAPLRLVERDTPVPGPNEALIRVKACGVCRTDLHIADGELARAKLPLVLGHEIVGEVAMTGPGVLMLAPTVPVKMQVRTYPLSDANRALEDLRCGMFTGAAVLIMS